MKRLTLIIALVYTFSQLSQAQKLNKRILDEKFKAKNNVIYVLNGVLYEQKDSINLDSAMNSYPAKNLITYTKLATTDLNFCSNNDVIIIYYATQQKRKVIRKKLNELKGKFPNKHLGFSMNILEDIKYPMLFIGNKQIHHTETKKYMDELKISDIYFIDYEVNSQTPDSYDTNAKNGLIRLWTKQGQKEH